MHATLHLLQRGSLLPQIAHPARLDSAIAAVLIRQDCFTNLLLLAIAPVVASALLFTRFLSLPPWCRHPCHPGVPARPEQVLTSFQLFTQTMQPRRPSLSSRVFPRRRTIVISLEGNIGAGKTTILRAAEALLLAEHIEVIYEPIHQRPELLRAFYRDPRRYARELQAEVIRLYAAIIANSEAAVVVVERSPLASLNVFAEHLWLTGVLTDAEYGELFALFQAIGWCPDGVVCVDTPADLCLQRIQGRPSASDESSIDLQYLEALEERYASLLEDRILVRRLRVLQGTDDVQQNVQQLVDAVVEMAASA